MAQDDAAAMLIKFMADEKVPFSERRRCAEFLLNYEHRNEVKITLDKWQENIEGILVDTDHDEIIYGEIVEESELTYEPTESLPGLLDDAPRYGRGNRLQGR
ncbi:MAG: hypothetical protein V9G04_10170 [Nocardioides sp.]